MALLTTGEWHEITWLPTSASAWASLATAPAVPSGVIQPLVDGTSMMIYVTNAASGTFVFYGGVATGFDDTLIAVDGGVLTDNTWTDNDGGSFVFAVDSSNIVWMYDAPNQTLRSFPAAGATGSAAMKAFLP